MITFESVKYKNFLSTGNKFISIILNKNDKTLIVGKNGAGKSQLIDALTFALYGKAFRKINLGQLVNSINQKKAVVELKFSIGSMKYRIVRGISPAKFEIYINDNLKPQDSSIKDYQRFLENSILQMSEKTFRQIVVLGSTSYVPFMRLSAADRRTVIEDLLDIQVFSIMNFLTKTRMNVVGDEYKEVQNELRILNNSLELKKKHLEDMKNKSIERIDANNKEIKFLNEKIETFKDNNDNINTTIGEMRTDIADGNNTIEKRDKINSFHTQIKRNKNKFASEINFFENNEQCPKCKQDIDSDFKEEHLCSIKDKIINAEKGLKAATTELDSLNGRIKYINDILDDIIEKEREIITNDSEITSIEAYIKKLIADNKDLLNADNNFFDESEIDEINDELDKYKGKRDNLTSRAFYYSTIVEMLKDGGIKTRIIKSYIPIINKLIRKYFDIMEFGIDFTFDESFSESISDRKRDKHTYFSFSEGEKMRIDLCLLFTWRELTRLRNSAATNLLIFDEIGDSSLDDSGFEVFMKIINESAKNQNVFIISHKGDVMADKFRNVISFEKVGNFTEMK